MRNETTRNSSCMSLQALEPHTCMCSSMRDTTRLRKICVRRGVLSSRQGLGLLRVVPRPFPCHEPSGPLSPILFGEATRARRLLVLVDS